MAKKLAVIVAKDLNNGIGYQGSLPWPSLHQDLKFLRLKSSTTVDPGKQNAIIVGRLTWESIPAKNRPLKNRYNVVLSSRKPEEIPGAHMVCSTFDAAVDALNSPPLSDKIESIFVLGGASVYEKAMQSPLCDTLYITEVLAEFKADTFFPPIDTTVYQRIEDPDDPLVPKGVLEENGIKYKFSVYKRVSAPS